VTVGEAAAVAAADVERVTTAPVVTVVFVFGSAG
jgi:hypothetical protein